MIDIYISKYHDVYTNIAIERYLFKHAQDDVILFLWSNNPCVVFGRNQNIYNEVNLPYAKQHNISLIRRFSGGGAVYQDLGNLNYTFICKQDSDINYLNQIILDTFKNLDLNAYFSGRNDLLINDKKFSGIAYCNDFDHLMYHGTCLVDVNVTNLVNVLKPHDYKLKSHSVSSYKSRIINLKEIKDITSNDIINSFIKVVKNKDEINLIDDISLNNEIISIKSMLEDEKYIYEDCPSYSYELDIKLNHANYHFELDYKNGVIEHINIYTDDLSIDKKEEYYNKLINKEIKFSDVETYLKNMI